MAWGKWRASWRERTRSQNQRALETEVRRLRIEIAAMDLPTSQGTWLHEANALVKEAQDVLDRQPGRLKIHGAWTLALAARRKLIYGADRDGVEAEIAIVREEIASEVPGWRKKATVALLDSAKEALQTREVLPYEAIESAMRVRDEHTQKLYRDALALSLRVGILTAITVLTVVALVILLWTLGPACDCLPVGTCQCLTGGPTPLFVALFGLLGGSISAYKPITRPAKRFAEQWGRWFLTAVRPFVGAAAALALSPLVLSGLLPLEENSFNALAAVSVAAGFSERLLSQALATIAPSGDDKASEVR